MNKKDIKPSPEFTPEKIKLIFKALESKGLIYYQKGGVYVPTETGWKLLLEVKPTREEIIAWGHPNITAKHSTTFEITKDEEIRKDADCIIGVRANKACIDLKKEFKEALKEAKKVEITIEASGEREKIIAFGSPALKLTHETDVVVRKSDFIDSRTLAIMADKAACDLNRKLVEKLKDPKTEIRIILEIKD